jgi:SAM-dependent methyltransferase
VKPFGDHFSHLAASYAQFRPQYPRALYDWVAAQCATRERAWDCACGSGQATLALAERFDAVIATDASAEQVAAAPPHPRVTYAVAPAEVSGLPAASIDCIAVAQALHWFDLGPFYAEVRRIAKPGALIAAWTYDVLHVGDAALDAIVQEFYAGTLGKYWPAERRHVERRYADLPFPFDELHAPPLEMHVSWSLAHLIGMFASWSAVGRYRKATGQDPLSAVGNALAARWGDPATERRMTWGLSMRAGRVSLQP